MPRHAQTAHDVKATIADVARHAGVSVGTVSHVINGTSQVNEARRTRVLAAIAALGYAPNRLAQGLRRGRSRTIGICMPNMTSAYFGDLFNHLEGLAAADGYAVMQVLSHQDPELERQRLAALLSHQVAGLVILPSPAAAVSFDLVAASGVPMVVLDRSYPDDRFDYVTIDNHGAMAEVAERLIALGHRRLLFIVTFPDLITTRQRIEALVAAAGARRRVRAEIMVRGDDERDFAARLAAAMRTRSRPTAIVASNTLVALWLLRSLAPLGLRCPDDISILVFEHPDWADVMTPPLAVVEPPSPDLARIAWGLLRERIAAGPLPCRRRELQASLTLRGSVGPRFDRKV